MFIELNFSSGKPPYLQIADQVKTAAAAGALRPGESLPGIRSLAERLRVNRNTVAKAYAELARQGIVETQAGKGCFLANSNSPYKKSVRQQILLDAVDAAVVQAHHLQVPPDQFLKVVRERLAAFAKRAPNQSTGKD